MSAASAEQGSRPRSRVDRNADPLVKKAYQFAGLERFPHKKRLSIYAADLGFFGLINLIGRTVRFTVEGWQHWEEATRDGHIPIYTFWHDCIFLATYFWRQRDIVVHRPVVEQIEILENDADLLAVFGNLPARQRDGSPFAKGPCRARLPAR